MTMLRSLEILSYGKDQTHYPVSPKLLDPVKLETWRRNILKSGEVSDRQRYTEAIAKPNVREKLGLTSNHGS